MSIRHLHSIALVTNKKLLNGHNMQPLNMKVEHVFLDERNSYSKAYKVKVEVIEKGCLKISHKKGLFTKIFL